MPACVQQAAVCRMRLAETGAGKAWHDVTLPEYQEFALQRQPFAAAAARVPPIGDGRVKRGFAQGVRHVAAELLIGPGIFVATSLADGFGQTALEVAEKWEGSFRAPFLAHEQHGNCRRKERDRKRGFDGFRFGKTLQPVTERAVADLVVVLQEVD